MNACEQNQINISAMMDGELYGDELTETVQHLAVCPTCMKEFQNFQELQNRVNSEIHVPNVPAQLWEDLSQQVPTQRKTQFIPLRSTWVKYIAAAAVIAIAFGVGRVSNQPAQLPLLPDPNAPIVLASNSGNMNDAQFLSLTRELLTADPVYHQKMYSILEALNRDRGEKGFRDLEQDRSAPPVELVNADNSEKKVVYKF
ncbi:MAG: hypothetical protein NTW14_13380 [bacterium]|nr:hypothetical protein [bacterium]